MLNFNICIPSLSYNTGFHSYGGISILGGSVERSCHTPSVPRKRHTAFFGLCLSLPISLSPSFPTYHVNNKFSSGPNSSSHCYSQERGCEDPADQITYFYCAHDYMVLLSYHSGLPPAYQHVIRTTSSVHLVLICPDVEQ